MSAVVMHNVKETGGWVCQCPFVRVVEVMPGSNTRRAWFERQEPSAFLMILGRSEGIVGKLVDPAIGIRCLELPQDGLFQRFRTPKEKQHFASVLADFELKSTEERAPSMKSIEDLLDVHRPTTVPRRHTKREEHGGSLAWQQCGSEFCLGYWLLRFSGISTL